MRFEDGEWKGAPARQSVTETTWTAKAALLTQMGATYARFPRSLWLEIFGEGADVVKVEYDTANNIYLRCNREAKTPVWLNEKFATFVLKAYPKPPEKAEIVNINITGDRVKMIATQNVRDLTPRAQVRNGTCFDLMKEAIRNPSAEAIRKFQETINPSDRGILCRTKEWAEYKKARQEIVAELSKKWHDPYVLAKKLGLSAASIALILREEPKQEPKQEPKTEKKAPQATPDNHRPTSADLRAALEMVKDTLERMDANVDVSITRTNGAYQIKAQLHTEMTL